MEISIIATPTFNRTVLEELTGRKIENSKAVAEAADVASADKATAFPLLDCFSATFIVRPNSEDSNTAYHDIEVMSLSRHGTVIQGDPLIFILHGYRAICFFTDSSIPFPLRKGIYGTLSWLGFREYLKKKVREVNEDYIIK